ncbi:MAG: type II toxin-antitoxin system PemK/MazF family toxin [Verrucomicrobiota bacterium]
MPASSPSPQRGELWMVNFDPQQGDEIRKERPAIVVNLPFDPIFDVRLVVPVTGWQSSFDA